MSLSAREQHALDSIETALTGSDPDLAVLLATFGRLTSGEEMPTGELLGTRWWHRRTRRLRVRAWVPACGRAAIRTVGRGWGGVRRLWRRLGWPRTGLLLWIVVSVGLMMLAPVINRGSQRTCPSAWVVACARLVPAHAGRPSGAAPPAAPPPAANPSARPGVK
jgi:hypothetical protein